MNNVPCTLRSTLYQRVGWATRIGNVESELGNIDHPHQVESNKALSQTADLRMISEQRKAIIAQESEVRVRVILEVRGRDPGLSVDRRIRSASRGEAIATYQSDTLIPAAGRVIHSTHTARVSAFNNLNKELPKQLCLGHLDVRTLRLRLLHTL